LHGDLTGKENVYLYGAVLGMSRARIRAQFDEIVEFAELNNAIDRQVKFYSAGMQMRLGFSIAAFLEPDILLVDEALAVGDANFQNKCLVRINEIVRSGTTLLYVSHDLASVEASCERAIWLSDAVVRAAGPTKEVLSLYRSSVSEATSVLVNQEGEVDVLKVELHSADGGQVTSEAEAVVTVTCSSPKPVHSRIFLGISQGTAFPMFVIDTEAELPEGQCQIECRLGYLPIPKGHYSLWMAVREWPFRRSVPLLPWQPVASFDTFGPERRDPPDGVMTLSPIHVGASWTVR
jgi:ABC-2 type transport system ATP-binding protein